MVTFLFPDKVVRKYKRLSGKLIIVKTNGHVAPAQQDQLCKPGTNWPGDLKSHAHTDRDTRKRVILDTRMSSLLCSVIVLI